MRIARFLRAFYFSCLVLFLFVPLELHAQTEEKEHVADLIQCSIEIETGTWSQGKPIFVVVQLKNISEKDVNLLGIYTFELSGVPPYQKLFEVVPKGNYDLIFDVETDWRVNSDNIPDVTHIASNRVRIVVE